jgi:hypothetical protein
MTSPTDARCDSAGDGTAVLAALADRRRDNARTPMHRDGGANAGFTTGTRGSP